MVGGERVGKLAALAALTAAMAVPEVPPEPVRKVPLPVIPKDRQGRTCGLCTECCTNLAVPELSKPAGVACVHLVPGKGCGIYETRPESCRAFECYWLQGAGDLYVRPDRSGAVLAEVAGVKGAGGVSVALYVDPEKPERWRGSKYLRKMVDRAIDAGHTVYIIGGDKYRRVITADPVVAKVAGDLMAELGGDDNRVVER